MNGESIIQARHAGLIARIKTACLSYGRNPADVQLLAVSKTFDAQSILQVTDLGQTAFGESYLQEALPKIETCVMARPEIPFEWHFIGPIQSNKTRPIAEHFHWVQSVDRDKIARRLSEQRPEGLKPLNICLQMNVSAEDSKSGCPPGQALELARLIATLPRLKLRGLMAIPAPTERIELQREQFARVRAVYENIRNALRDEDLTFDTLSMGMSDDLESAIAEGSTMVRVGSALFGQRSYPASQMSKP